MMNAVLATAAIVATTWIGLGAVAAIAAKLVFTEGGERREEGCEPSPCTG